MAQVHTSETLLRIGPVNGGLAAATQLFFICWRPSAGQLPQVLRQVGVPVCE